MKAQGEAKRVLIAANPKSGAGPSGALVEQLQRELSSRGLESEIVFDLDVLEQRAAELRAKSQLQCIVSAGGDGTVSAIANRVDASVPIAIFPLGTENLLALHLGLTADPVAAADSVLANQQVSMDVGSASGQLFLVMLSIGFDALVVQDMTHRRRGHINRFSYGGPIVRSMMGYRFPMLHFAAGEPISAAEIPKASSGAPAGDATTTTREIPPAAWAFVFNVPRYAAGLEFCPAADPHDEKLDLCTFRRPGLVNGFSYLFQLWLSRHQRSRDFLHTRVSRLTVSCPTRADIPFQIDGDFGGTLPVEIETLPGRLRLLTPAGTPVS